MRDELIFIGPILGVIAGSLGTVLVAWITRHYDEQSKYRELIIKTSMEYFKEALIASRNASSLGKKSSVYPYESFVISISHLVNKVVRKDFDINQIEEVVKENRKIIKALEKLYSK